MGDDLTGVRIKGKLAEQVEAFEEDNPALFEGNRSKTIRQLIGRGLETEGYEPGIELPERNGEGADAEAVADGGFANPSFLATITAVLVLLTTATVGWAWFVQTEFLTQVGLMFTVLTVFTATLFLSQELYNHATGAESGV